MEGASPDVFFPPPKEKRTENVRLLILIGAQLKFKAFTDLLVCREKSNRAVIQVRGYYCTIEIVVSYGSYVRQKRF